MSERDKLIELFCEAKKTDPESAPFSEFLADYLISNGVTFQQWIPVTERLPEEGDRCLCNVKSFAFPGSFYRTILRYSKVGFHDGCVYEEGVTHWMPLPEPPKEG